MPYIVYYLIKIVNTVSCLKMLTKQCCRRCSAHEPPHQQAALGVGAGCVWNPRWEREEEEEPTSNQPSWLTHLSVWPSEETDPGTRIAMKWLRFSLLVLGVFSLCCATAGDSSGVKKMKMQFATGPLLKFQIWWAGERKNLASHCELAS